MTPERQSITVHVAGQTVVVFDTPVATLDVIIPSVGRPTLARALESLAQGSALPDSVTVVSNEVPPDLASSGLPLRVLGFDSERYPYGVRDVALRRNVGIFASGCAHVLTFDDDQVAPRSMVADVRRLLEAEPVLWGHHRYVAMAGLGVAELLDRPPARGRAREHPPNGWHGWQSCYGGLFAARRDVVEAVGGFDLGFAGRHAGEDQDLGRRLARRLTGRERVYVHEPPFAWHPTAHEPWPPTRTNVCPSGEHALVPEIVGGARGERCTRCPWFVTATAPSNDRGDAPVIRFDPSLVAVSVFGS